jgi:HD-GYP domain-containing protein (c-di-GMP phosphodiesterase class II)
MPRNNKKQLTVEISLLLVVIGLTCLLHQMPGYRMIVLNLYYLPAMLGALFLGQYRGGLLTLFCVMSAFTFIVFDINKASTPMSPLIIGLALSVWAAVLGLSTLLVSTLSDERQERIGELHDAYVGIVQLLSNYLSSSDPRLRDQSVRLSDLSCHVAQRMKLSREEVDNVRVASLLQEMENVEITARVLRKAIGNLRHPSQDKHHTFHGTDLVQSLGNVLSRALPLLADTSAAERSTTQPVFANPLTLGAEIIRMVRRYDELTQGSMSAPKLAPAEAIQELRTSAKSNSQRGVLQALESIVGSPAPSASRGEGSPEAGELAVV